MDTTVINIGNSKGLIIPAEMLKQLKLTAKSAVKIFMHDNRIVIEPNPRQGWAEAAEKCHKNGDDKLLMPDVMDDECPKRTSSCLL
jgi:antitoxin MazE